MEQAMKEESEMSEVANVNPLSRSEVAGITPIDPWEAAGCPWVDPLPAADDEPMDWRLPWPEGQKTVLRCPILTMRRAEALIRVGHLDYARHFLFEQKHAAAPAIRSLNRPDWDARLDRCLAELDRRERLAA